MSSAKSKSARTTLGCLPDLRGVMVNPSSSSFPVFSSGIFSHVMRLDKPRVNENLWWIITTNVSNKTFKFEKGNKIFPLKRQN